MTLLWADAAAHQLAARQAAWWNGEREFDHEGDDEHPLRDPSEPVAKRRERYISQIVDRHNVPRENAEHALRHVYGHLAAGHHMGSPVDYGFASQSRDYMSYPAHIFAKLQDPDTWKGRPVVQVPAEELHATQDFLRHGGVAHNLFWPGHRRPVEDDAEGDPDYEPESEHEREESGGDDEFPDPEQRELHRTAKVLVHRNGSRSVLDGHHRAAADILLGKKTTPAQEIHERELDTSGGAIRELPYPESIQDHRDHLIHEHGYSAEAVHHMGLGTKPIAEHDFDHQDHQDDLDHEHPLLCRPQQAYFTARSLSSASRAIPTG